jgi:fused signal recognition particle receptor
LTDLSIFEYLVVGAVALAVIVGVLALVLWRRSDAASDRRQHPLDAPGGTVRQKPVVEPPVRQEPSFFDESPEPSDGGPGAVIVEGSDIAQAPDIDFEVKPPDLPPPPRPRERTVRERLRDGLAKSRSALSARLDTIAPRGVLDEEAWEEVEEALIRADLGINVATAITADLADQRIDSSNLRAAIKGELVRALSDADTKLRFTAGGPSVWLIVGVNGVGKTTSIAKLAHLLSSEGKSVVLAAADTFRAAAIDQLGTWASRAGVHMIRHAPGADPGAVVYDAISYAKARDIDVVIVDTAGRIHTREDLMGELSKIRRVAEREAGEIVETLLVLDATVGQNGLAQAAKFNEAVDVSGVILTKLDGTARGGIVVSIHQEIGVGVKAIGVGEDIEDLQPFVPETFAEALLED